MLRRQKATMRHSTGRRTRKAGRTFAPNCQLSHQVLIRWLACRDAAFTSLRIDRGLVNAASRVPRRRHILSVFASIGHKILTPLKTADPTARRKNWDPYLAETRGSRLATH